MKEKIDSNLVCSDCENYPCYDFNCNEYLESSECINFKQKNVEKGEKDVRD